MLQRLRHRAQGQEGFTLIELLVVILIIGILAAVAIPTFLSQTNKANDSNAQSALGTIQTTEATYATSNGGSYTQSTSALQAIEPSLNSPDSTYSVAFPSSNTLNATASGGYAATATDAKDSVTFTLGYNAATGAITRTCAPQSTGACSASGTWGS